MALTVKAQSLRLAPKRTVLQAATVATAVRLHPPARPDRAAQATRELNAAIGQIDTQSKALRNWMDQQVASYARIGRMSKAQARTELLAKSRAFKHADAALTDLEAARADADKAVAALNRFIHFKPGKPPFLGPPLQPKRLPPDFAAAQKSTEAMLAKLASAKKHVSDAKATMSPCVSTRSIPPRHYPNLDHVLFSGIERGIAAAERSGNQAWRNILFGQGRFLPA